MGAYDEEEFPWIVEEKRWLVENTKLGRPVLGICLGCQLLADGGKAYRAPRVEIGFVKVDVNSAGANDPVMSHFSNPVLLCHGDTWDLPPNSTLLAESASYRQAFRHGSAVGVQFHPEATLEATIDWVKANKQRVTPDRYPTPSGIDDVGIIEEAKKLSEKTRAAAFGLFKAWMDTWPSVSTERSHHP